MNKKIKLSILGIGIFVLIAGLIVIFHSFSVSIEDAVQIILADSQTTVDGIKISKNKEDAVYLANDIIYYEDGKTFTYGAGDMADEHTQKEANRHNVIHITKPGVYALSGRLMYGQIAVDLGENAKNDKKAKVTLILNDMNVNCSVAPAIIFYNVYECGSLTKAKSNVNTKKAGANILIADGTVNNVKGTYVSEIFNSYELNEEKTNIVASETLHKYDGAISSKMSINFNGGKKDSGVLNIVADKEGIESEMHVTINGANINITSGSDGINAQKDGMSVTTINDGRVNIIVSDFDKEGDGIDSRGWIVINDGTIMANADKDVGVGLLSENGIIINGGTIMATGSDINDISKSKQNYAIFSFESKQLGEELYLLKDKNGDAVIEYNPVNAFSKLIISSKELKKGQYTFWRGIVQLERKDKEEMNFEIGKKGNYFNNIAIVD